jgi:hypothetical protein
MHWRILKLLGIWVWLGSSALPSGAQNARLAPAQSADGYLARVLINETAFPGEPGFRSEEDSKAGMLAVLWVLHSRIHHVPEGYTQKEIAQVESRCILDVITVGSPEGGQLHGFFRARNGMPSAIPRVHQRIDYLLKVANQGPPGRVSRLINHAQELATSYFHQGPCGEDIFQSIRHIDSTRVTGRSYSWMTDKPNLSPGGRYVRIPRSLGGVLGGNRFFTLQAAH